MFFNLEYNEICSPLLKSMAFDSYVDSGVCLEIAFKKPITYSAIKHGVIGITKYLSTYYAKFGIRTNCLCPGGVLDQQEKTFVKKVSQLIPMKRMANVDEYKSAIQFFFHEEKNYFNS